MSARKLSEMQQGLNPGACLIKQGIAVLFFAVKLVVCFHMAILDEVLLHSPSQGTGCTSGLQWDLLFNYPKEVKSKKANKLYVQFLEQTEQRKKYVFLGGKKLKLQCFRILQIFTEKVSLNETLNVYD